MLSAPSVQTFLGAYVMPCDGESTTQCRSASVEARRAAAGSHDIQYTKCSARVQRPCWVTEQMAAEGEVQEANVRAKHLEKQLTEQRKALTAKEKEAGSLAQELKRERSAVDACQQRCDQPLTNEKYLTSIYHVIRGPTYICSTGTAHVSCPLSSAHQQTESTVEICEQWALI